VVEKSQCGWNSGYGCVIIIDHGGGIKTLYGHNSRLLVNVGDHVEAGQTIGLMGNTGNVRGRTGIHLHFEVWVNGVRTNPFKFVK
jgi:murein DD-endopeptidase MepM/ murein hydrolase activator NlpD